jgi:short-subunit dehydrogenase
MKVAAGNTVLLTGASGGLGVVLARAFAALKTRIALVAYPGTGLDDLQREVERQGGTALAFVADLRDSAERRALVEEVGRTLGPVDILINDAGVEFTSLYHELSEENIRDVISVNLEAAMILTRLLLPGMLERGRGHIVNMSSLAAKSGPALQEPYAATKAALIAFTASLRATYAGTGVSASAIVPGFVQAGIYARLEAQSGQAAPALLRACPPEWVARAVLRSIEKDLPEVIVNRYPIRPMLMLSTLSPSLGEWLSARVGVHDFFRRVLAAQKSRPR